MLEGYLRWADVDPRARPPLDLARVEATIRPIVIAVGDAPGLRPEMFHRIQLALVAEFGPWIDGWAWGAINGGPVRSWCCVTHNILPDAQRRAANHPGRSATDATIDGTLAAIDDWRRCLDELAAMFERFSAELGEAPTGPALEFAIEYAASEVLPYTVQRTATEDAWYGTFTTLLGWYAEEIGIDPEPALAAIENTIDGKFQSWFEPDEITARSTCHELGLAIAGLAPKPPSDALGDWEAIRKARLDFVSRTSTDPVPIDGHSTFIETTDRARDPERADRLAAALVLCRDSARRDMALTLDQLAEWQAAVLGISRAPLRTGEAFAKRGRERYRYSPALWTDLEAHLAQASNPSEPVALRAARVYLDVCFYHPFEDGNARAARLALDHVLTRAGLGLHNVTPLFVVSRAAGNPNVLRSLAHVIDQLAGPIGYSLRT